MHAVRVVTVHVPADSIFSVAEVTATADLTYRHADSFHSCAGNCFAYFEKSVPRDIAIVLMLIHQIVAYGLVRALLRCY